MAAAVAGDAGSVRPGVVALVERFYEQLGAIEIDSWIELWQPDGVFEQPFATEGFPRRLEGRDEILHHVTGMDEIFRDFVFSDIEIHATADPDCFVMTLRSDSTIIPTGRRYANEYVVFLRLRDGLVAHYREYFNPLVVLDAFGDTGLLNAVFDVRKS
jgi:ketosteroid isomerase-like protein